MSPHTTEPGQLAPADASALGGRLRALRKRSGLTLKELAQRLDISASAVSQIERGQMNPSVNRLFAITQALGVPLAKVFVEPKPHPTASFATYALTRAHQTQPVELSSGVIFRNLSPISYPQLQFFESIYPPGSSGSGHGALNVHEGIEVGEVLEGELTIAFAHERVVMRPGDTITYHCDIPHLLSNESDTSVRAIWLVANQ